MRRAGFATRYIRSKCSRSPKAATVASTAMPAAGFTINAVPARRPVPSRTRTAVTITSTCVPCKPVPGAAYDSASRESADTYSSTMSRSAWSTS